MYRETIRIEDTKSIYSYEKWITKSRSHCRRISSLLGNYLEKREHQHKEPVLDFLFEYYSFRPALLKRWSPGINVILEGEKARTFLAYPEFTEIEDGIIVDPRTFPPRRIDSLRWIGELLERTSAHSPSLGCYGMHEWAMVYRTDTIRHPYLPLRLSPAAIAEFVESRSIICSHFDAFRFFTSKARPLNVLQPSRENRKELEQPGCIHANMDLYKWAYKIYPWISSDLIADAFELALDARIIDMKASPYDLREYGYDPIKIETADGRKTYKKEQKRICDQSRTIRDQLITSYKMLLKHLT